MKKILITGNQGLIGWNLYQLLPQAGYEVFGFSKTREPREARWYEGLLEDPSKIRAILQEIAPDLIIHAHAMCNLDVCEINPEKTHLINVRGTEVLLDALNPSQQKLVLMSTEHVFSGNKGNYQESDTPDPISVYGKTRVLAESMVREKFKEALIIRPGLVIGKSLQGDVGPQDWLRTRLSKGLPASYFTDEIRSPLRMADLAQGVELLIQKQCKGTYHLGGAQNMSRYDLALRLSKEMGLEGEILPKQRVGDRLVPRIGDCSLDSSKAQKEGWTIPRVGPIPSLQDIEC
jgi:dTDP-4-dehydrorhamnose reductase